MDTTFVHSGRVHFYLSDNTPANQLVGNVRQAVRLNYTLMRILLKPETLFRVNSHGELFSRETIDRDTVCARLNCCDLEVCQYQMDAYLFEVQPNPPKTVQIIISITDENDNAPAFFLNSIGPKQVNTVNSSSYWELKIPESTSVGSQYALPPATDLDSKRYGLKGYKLLPQNSTQRTSCSNKMFPFSLNSGQVAIDGISTPYLRVDHALDRELCEGYDMYLVAEDSGKPPLSSALHVHVSVLDINDSPPVFINISSLADLNIHIPEDISVGTVIYRILTEDPDEGINGQVVFSIDMEVNSQIINKTLLDQITSKYTIHPSTGEIRVIRGLDYENELERRLVLIVRASDQGTPSLSSTVSLTIYLRDVNDNAPSIDVIDAQPPDMSIRTSHQSLLQENDPEPRLLKLITVTDADQLSVDKITCTLIDTYSLDFELRPYSSSMYGLLNKRAFDYETDLDDLGQLSLLIQCTDDALPKMTTVERIRIVLEDENDNWPKFTHSNFELYVSEDTPVDTVLGQILATDADSGPRGKITYTLNPVSGSPKSAEYNNSVRIDHNTGTLYLSKPLDREEISRMVFHVTASDCFSAMDCASGERKTNTTQLTIIVLDVNDNPPRYRGPTTLHVSENVPVGTAIVDRLLFSDPDFDRNGTFDVSIIEVRKLSGAFSLDDLRLHDSLKNTVWYSSPVGLENNSRLYIVRSPDREEEPMVLFKLLVVDRGSVVKLSTTTSLLLYVDDVNDNRPELIFPKNGSVIPGPVTDTDWSNSISASSSIPIDLPWGTPIVTIKAKDIDSGANGTVTYHICTKSKRSSHRSASVTYQSADSRIQKSQDNVNFPDAAAYFQISEFTGELQTAWGEGSPGSRPMNDSKAFKPSVRTLPPELGFYILHVELRDTGTPPQKSFVLFYVNISEPIGKSFAYYLFNGMSMSNMVLMFIIISCSLILIVTLIGAIVWVRLRKDSSTIGEACECTNRSPGMLSPKLFSDTTNAVPYLQIKQLGKCALDEESVEHDSASWRPKNYEFVAPDFHTIDFSPRSLVRTNFSSTHCGCLHGTFHRSATLMHNNGDPLTENGQLHPIYPSATKFVMDDYSQLHGIPDPTVVSSMFYQPESSYLETTQHSFGGTATNSNNGGSDSGIDSGTGFVAPIMIGLSEANLMQPLISHSIETPKSVFSMKTMNL